MNNFMHKNNSFANDRELLAQPSTTGNSHRVEDVKHGWFPGCGWSTFQATPSWLQPTSTHSRPNLYKIAAESIMFACLLERYLRSVAGAFWHYATMLSIDELYYLIALGWYTGHNLKIVSSLQRLMSFSSTAVSLSNIYLGTWKFLKYW